MKNEIEESQRTAYDTSKYISKTSTVSNSLPIIQSLTLFLSKNEMTSLDLDLFKGYILCSLFCV